MAYKNKEEHNAQCRRWARENPERSKAIKRKSASKRRAHKAAVQRQRYIRNPDYARNYNLKKKYGITLEEYNLILEGQNFRCKCCGKPESEQKQKLHVDHDHTTGEIRGLLCFLCNRRLIQNHRDPELFRKAATYLDGPFLGRFVPTTKKKKNGIHKSS